MKITFKKYYRILTWKNKQNEQADEVVIQNSFVFRVANSLKKDQDRNIRRNQFEASQISFEENQELLEDNEHQEIFTSLTELVRTTLERWKMHFHIVKMI